MTRQLRVDTTMNMVAEMPATQNGARQAALKRGLKRSQTIVDRVLAAMALIEREIAGNEGVYPRNQGEVTMTELASRADISLQTLYAPKHKDHLGKDAKAWVDSITGQVDAEVGELNLADEETESNSKSLPTRYSELRTAFKGLLQSHRDTELELQQVQHDLEASVEQNASLRAENASLRAQLAEAGTKNIVGLVRKKSS